MQRAVRRGWLEIHLSGICRAGEPARADLARGLRTVGLRERTSRPQGAVTRMPSCQTTCVPDAPASRYTPSLR